MRVLTRALMLSAGLVTLAACGQTGAPASAQKPGALSAANEARTRSLAQQGNFYLAQFMRGSQALGNPQSLGGVFQSSVFKSGSSQVRAQAGVPGCTTPSPLSYVDEDGDYLPRDLTSTTFECAYDGGGLSLTAYGSVSAVDQDDSKATGNYSGYTVNLDAALLLGADQTTFGTRVKLGFDLKRLSPGSYTLNENLLLSDLGPNAAPYFTNRSTLTYRGDDAQHPYQSGTLNGNSLSAVLVDGQLLALNAQLKQLHFSQECATGFDGGAIVYQDTAGNDLTFTFDGCNTPIVSYNGTVQP